MRLYSLIVGNKTWDNLFLKEFVIVLDIIKNSFKQRSVSQGLIVQDLFFLTFSNSHSLAGYL